MASYVLAVLLLLGFSGIVAQDYDNPVFPSSLPELPSVDPFYKKHIPRRLWIAVKDRKDELPGTLKQFFSRNQNWNITVCDNLCKDNFMSTIFAGTSILWAYNAINPAVGAAKADIWRYAVLYTYGGVYLDDDSDIRKPLDEIIQETDYLLMSEEGSSSLGDCYNPNYHLSDVATFQAYPNYTSAMHFDGINKDNVPMFFHDHTLVNWGIFIAPRHPILERTLRNVVEIIRAEYIRRSVIHFARWEPRWKFVMCSTGFVLTYSTREIELENSIPASMMPKISVNNFHEHGGNVKAIWTGADPNHYMKAMNRKGGPLLLKSYAEVPLAQIVDHLEGKAVMGDAGKEIFLIMNGQKRPFGDYETFINLGFLDKHNKHMSDAQLEQVPLGPTVTMQDEKAIKDLIRKRLEMPAIWKHYSSSAGVGSLTTAVPTILPTIDPEAAAKTRALLADFTVKFNNMTVLCFGDDYAGTRDDYLNNVYQNIIGDTPVMVYPFCARTFQLGMLNLHFQ